MFWFWFLILLLIIAIFAVPTWPYSRGWGYYPAGGALAIFLLILFAIWLGWLAFYWPWVTPVAAPPA